MTRQLVRKPISWAKLGPNARSDLGDEKKARALFRSRVRRQLMPLIAAPDGTLWDGNRTFWGWQLEGRPDAELDFIVSDEEITRDQLAVIQANSALHREPLRDADFAVVLRDTLVANPSMTRKEVAEDLFGIDPSLATRYISLFDCVPEVQDAAKAGKLGVSEWYAISKSSDQLSLLRRKLDGATRDELERQVRKDRVAGKPTVRTCKIKCPLPSGHVITVAGDELSLDEAIESLKEAIKAMTKARDTGLNAATAQRVWSDMAKAS